MTARSGVHVCSFLRRPFQIRRLSGTQGPRPRALVAEKGYGDARRDPTGTIPQRMFRGGVFQCRQVAASPDHGHQVHGRTHAQALPIKYPHTNPQPHPHTFSDATTLHDNWTVPVESLGEVSPDRVKTPVMRNIITGDVMAKAKLKEQSLYDIEEWYSAFRHAPFPRTPPLCSPNYTCHCLAQGRNV